MATIYPADSTTTITPFSIKQMLVAMEIGATDESILNYVDFFIGIVPTAAACLLHVLPKYNLKRAYFEEETATILGDFDLNKEVLNDMKDKTRNFISQKDNLNIDWDTREGKPIEEVLKKGVDIQADLVVIGENTEAVHHGIVIRNFVRQVHSNTLIVPDRALPKLKRIVVPIDFSPISVKAIQTAVGINQQLKHPCEIICLNIYELPPLNLYGSEQTKRKISALLEKDRIQVFNTFLQTYVTNPEDLRFIRTYVLENQENDIGKNIHAFAKAHQADLVIMGAKDFSKETRLLMGSVTERLLALNKDKPVMILK